MSVSDLVPLAAKYFLPIIFALLVFIVGRWLANLISRRVHKVFDRAPNSDPTLSRFFASVIRYLLLIVVVIASLTVLGVETSSLSVIILAAGAALAFVLAESLSDLAAGVMLLLFRPFQIGDEVQIGGYKGVVQAIDLIATRMKTRDNVAITVSNSKAWGGVIHNYTALGQRRLDMDFGVGYGADIDKAITVIKNVANDDSRILADPAPWAKVVSLDESSVTIQLRAWCKYDDLRGLKVSISQPIKEALDKAGINIPYPHSVKIKQKVKVSKTRDRVKKLKAMRQKPV